MEDGGADLSWKEVHLRKTEKPWMKSLFTVQDALSHGTPHADYTSHCNEKQSSHHRQPSNPQPKILPSPLFLFVGAVNNELLPPKLL